jgi:hypothetical protein
VLFWGLLMTGLATLGVTVFEGSGQFALLMFWVGGATIVLAVVLAVTGLGESAPPRVLALPELSPPTVCVALGFVGMALGAVWGLWLVLIAAGFVLVGLAGVARELRAQRRALREASRR